MRKGDVKGVGFFNPERSEGALSLEKWLPTKPAASLVSDATAFALIGGIET
jgi:hypothetical protein